MNINLIQHPQKLKRTVYKVLNIFASLALIMNMSMVGVFITPHEAQAAGNPSANLDQCANDPAPSPSNDGCATTASEWVNGNLNQAKSVYYEGDTIPYRMTFDNLSLDSHTVTFEWDTTKSGKHAIDYLTTFNETVTTADPTLGITGLGAPTTFTIPADPQVTGAGVTPIAGDFTLYGGTITAASAYSYSNGAGFVGDKSASITLTFTASVANPVLAWGGHISERADWGDENSAVAIPGSPYHTRLLDLDGSGGNQDRSLSAEAVIFPASITVIKDAIPEGPQSFNYSTTGGLSPVNFSLVDDGTATDTKVYNDIINFTTYTVTESAVAGWDLNGIVCSVTSANGGSQTVNIPEVSINLKEGENVTCTYTNDRQEGNISGYKWKDMNNNGTWDTGEPGLGGWEIKLGGDATSSTVTAADGSYSFSNLNPGNYTVSETLQNNWIQTYPIGNLHNITLAAGQNKTDVNFGNVPGQCNLELHKSGPKTANPGDDITYTITYDNTGTADCTGGGVTITDVIPQYSTYVDHNPKTSSNFDGQQVVWNVGTVSPGESGVLSLKINLHERPEICGKWTVENRASFWSNQMSGWSNWVYTDLERPCEGKLKVIKHVINDNGGNASASDFNIHVKDNGNDVTGSPQAGSETGNTYTLTPGTYAVSEDAFPGYTQTSIVCDGQQTDTVTIAHGDSKICTITNDDNAPKIKLIKEVINDDGGNALPNDFNLTIGGVATNSGDWMTVEANQAYALNETQLPGYEFVSLTGDNKCPAVLGGTVTLDEGEMVVCTIKNNDKGAKITLIKKVINDDGGNAQPNDFKLTIGGVATTSGTAMAVKANQAYALNETQLSGYSFVSLTGDAKCPSVLGGEVTLDEGEHVTCTITNDDKAPKITLIKKVINNNGGNALPNDFNLTIGGVATTSGTAMSVEANKAYALNETQLSGYEFVSLTGDAKCPSVLGGEVTLDEGEHVTCTITNDDKAPKITLIKKVINNDGGNALPNDFKLTIGGIATTSGTAMSVEANKAYALNETQLNGYSFVSLTGDAKCPSLLGGTVTLDEGEHVTCTITNNDIAPKIRLIKKVINDNGGNAKPDDFQLTIGGSSTLSGDWMTVEANKAYALNETQLNGYSFVSLTGDAKCPSVLGGEVTLDEGENITCTITNDDKAPKITLIKKVQNIFNGDAQPNDFKLTIGGVATTSGTAMSVEANKAYALNETQLSGYEFVSLTGDAKCPSVLGGSVTLDEGEHVTCTITNQDIAPKITLIKKVINDDGGNALPNDFKLTIGGNPANSGITYPVKANTAYKLNETQLTGYSFVSLTGDAKCPSVLGGEVTLDEGENITCTITNDDKAPKITLIKKVINDDGGNALPNDFKLTIGGVATTSGTAMAVKANQAYALNETQLSGYEFVSLTGDAKCPSVLGGSVTLDEGEEVTCTITNDDKAPKITLIKQVLSGDAKPNDFKLTIGGVATTSGTAMAVKANQAYALNETQLSGYSFVSLTGDAKCPSVLGGEVTLDEGEEVTCTIKNERDVGDLRIKKYEDINGNGKKDSGEPYMTGWEFVVKQGTNLISVGQTGDDGDYLIINNLPTGSYDVTEILKTNWINTDPGTTPATKKVTVYKNQMTSVWFGNFELGKISGHKFEDVNGNGTWDVGEPALAGWTINLDNGSSDVTDANGYYAFTGLVAGDYNLTETQQAGWKQTTTNPTTISITSGKESKNNDFGNFKKGKISGHKFEDVNGNGTWDVGEPALAGWTINLDNGSSDVTDANGYYEFTGLMAGDYNVTETNQTGWVQTTTTPSTITVISGTNSQDNDFGNFKKGKISGYKFEDMNANGVWDSGEPIIAGWEIYLTGKNNTSTTTDANGYYEFDNLTAGTWTVTEKHPTGWIQTTTNPAPIVMTSGMHSQDNNFGNFEKGKISGYKFEDVNGNGVWDNGEPALSGWTINLDNGDYKVTDANGYYEFKNLVYGDYNVTETNQTGWMQTTPNPATITMTSGTDSKNNNFGNFEKGKISGYKFEDVNGNGIWDTGEPAIENWNIYISGNWAVSTQTDSNGYYEFDNLNAGTWTVTEENPTGWLQTTPNPAPITVLSGTDSKDNNFGNFELGTITGYKFEDINNNGVWDGQETGLEGWEINLWDDNAGQPGTIIDSTLTNEFGMFEFTGLVAGTYWLSETLQTGWYQYAPVGGVFGPIVVMSGYDNNNQEAYFEFGNAEAITLTLDKYNDQEVAQGGDGILETTETISYHIDWGVSGNSIATNVILTDIIPAELNLDVASISDAGVWDANTRTITWDFGDQQPYASGFVTYTATLNVPVADGTIILNVAKISADNSDPQYLEDESEVTVKSDPILEIVKSVNVDWTNPGTTIIYTVTVTNVGTDAAINVMLSDLLPDGFTFETTGLATHEWLLDTRMEVGESQTVSYAVNVGEEVLAGFYDNLATTWADNHGELSDIATVEVRIPVVEAEEADPVLTIVKTVDKDFINAGDSVTYTVVVTNTGDSEAEAVAINVKMQDLLPAGFTFEDGSVTKTWDLGDMKQGESRTITYVAVSHGTVIPGDYENLAVAWADNHGNVTDDAVVEVRQPIVLGEELPTTGGSVMNFIYLFAAGLVLVFSLYMLRLTSAKKETE